MKKLVLVSLFASAVICANAQNNKYVYGVTAGINLNSLTSYRNDARIGFHIGFKTKMDFSNNLYINTGLLLSSKAWYGMGTVFPEEHTSLSWKATSYYFNIPIHAGYRIHLANKVKLFAEAGPYIAIGMSGSSSSTLDTYSEDLKTIINSKKDDTGNPFKNNQERFDWGLGGNIGIELFNHYQFSVGYDFGLKGIYGKDSKAKNKTFMISASYLF